MKSLAGSLLLVGISLATVLASGEMILRSLVGRSDGTPLHTFSTDPFVPRLRPGTIAVRHGVEIRIDDRGFRVNAAGNEGAAPSAAADHPTSAATSPGDTVRVLVLGDSYAFGTGVAGDETIPARLEAALSRATGPGSGAGGAVEVVNMGLEGANAYDHRARLEQIGLALDPDVVVLLFLFNDIHGMENGSEWMAARGEPRPADWAGDRGTRRRGGVRLLVVPYLRSRLAGVARIVRKDTGSMGAWNARFRDGEPAWEEAKREILRAREATQRAGARFVLGVLPAMARLTERAYPLSGYREAVVSFAAREAIETVDLHDVFWGESARGYWIHPLDPHPNAEACDRMAQALAATIR